MQIISVNGNIGSGKSTLMNMLKKRLEGNELYIFIREPVDIWQNITDEEGVDLLTNFYKDKNAHSFKFQMAAYISRLVLLRNAILNNPGKIIITERCIHADRHIFAKMLYDQKKMTKMEFTIYDMWFDEFLNDLKNIKYVYIKTNTDICFERINKRNRSGESVIEKSYLDECAKYHDIWLDGINNIIQLDGNQEFENNDEVLNEWFTKIIN